MKFLKKGERDTEVSVHRDYDLFEKFPDGSLVWKCKVSGRNASIAKLKELAANTTNEVLMMHLPTNAVVASLNVPTDASSQGS